MSNQINNEINSNENSGWSEVRSKKMIKKTRMEQSQNMADIRSASPSSIPELIPATSSYYNLQNFTGPNTPVNIPTTPINILPTPVNVPPTTSINVSPTTTSNIPPTTSSNVPPTPINIPTYVPMNITGNDFWVAWLFMAEHSYQLAGRTVETIKHEFKYPLEFRGRPENIKRIDISQKLFGNIKNIINEHKPNSDLDNLGTEIKNKMIETCSSLELLSFTEEYNYSTFKKKVLDLFNLISESKKNIEVKPKEATKLLYSENSVFKNISPGLNTVPNVSSPKENSEPINVPEKNEEVSNGTDTSTNDKETENKYTVDQVIAYKTALVEAQEKFFVECLPTKEEIEENINKFQSSKEQIFVKKISTVDDDIKIGNFKFSKFHYLNNEFFQKRLIKKYESIFSPHISNLNISIPSKKGNQLKIAVSN